MSGEQTRAVIEAEGIHIPEFRTAHNEPVLFSVQTGTSVRCMTIADSGEIVVDGVCVDSFQPLLWRGWAYIKAREAVPYDSPRFRRLQKLIERCSQRIEAKQNKWIDKWIDEVECKGDQ